MNTQTQEALKMAIEALDNACIKIEKWTKGGKWTAGKEASLKCKEALAQPAQEPVAWMDEEGIWQYEWESHSDNKKPLYTHPAPSWQGLSDDEIYPMADVCYSEFEGVMGKGFVFDRYKFARAIEQALKEKNHG